VAPELTATVRKRNSPVLTGRVALLVVDAQNDFVRLGPPAAARKADRVIAVIKELIDACHAADVPVIYTREAHRSSGQDYELDGSATDPHASVPHTVEGSPGADIDDRIAPSARDIILVPKRRYDAFLGTDLVFVLNGLGVYPHNTLIITGFVTNVCVLHTAAGAIQRDYWVRVATDAVAAETEDMHEAALKILAPMQENCLVASQEILEQLHTGAGLRSPRD
jgi:ureidoacrylate peracid hydrolase